MKGKRAISTCAKENIAKNDDVVDDINMFDGVDVHIDPNQSDFGSDSDLEEIHGNDDDLELNDVVSLSLTGKQAQVVGDLQQPSTSDFEVVLQNDGFKSYFSQMVDQKIALAKWNG